MSQLPTEWQEVMKLAGVREQDMHNKNVVDLVMKTYKDVTGGKVPMGTAAPARNKTKYDEEDTTTTEYLNSIAALEKDPRVIIHGWLYSLRRKGVSKKWLRQYWTLYDGCFLVGARGPTFVVKFLDKRSKEVIDRIDMRGIDSTTVVDKKVSKEGRALPSTGIKLKRPDGKAKVLCMTEEDGMIFIEWLTALGDSLKLCPSTRGQRARHPPCVLLQKPAAPPMRVNSPGIVSSLQNPGHRPSQSLGNFGGGVARKPPPPRKGASEMSLISSSIRKGKTVSPPPPRFATNTPAAAPARRAPPPASFSAVCSGSPFSGKASSAACVQGCTAVAPCAARTPREN